MLRYGPDRLLINTATAMRGRLRKLENSARFTQVLKQHIDVHGPGKPFKKFKGYIPMVHGAPNTFTLINKKEHARRRRLLAPGLSDTALKSYESAILARIGLFCDSLLGVNGDTKSSRSQNVSEWCNTSTRFLK